MANRVCLGDRGADIGLFISKPGYNVLTTGDANLLFSSSFMAWQMVQTGQVSIANGSYATISFPNLGYRPTIVVLPHINGFNSVNYDDTPFLYTWCSNVTTTGARLHVDLSTYGYSYIGTASYCVFRIPADG